MKKVLILLSIVGLIGCGEKTEKKPEELSGDKFAFDTNAVVTSPISDANQQFQLEYKLSKDKDYFYRLTTVSKSTQEITADTTIVQSLNQTITYLLKLKLVQVETDNTMELTVNFNSVKLEAVANGQVFKYQSDMKVDSTERMKYAEYEAILNNPFNIRVTSSGEISEIFRTDRILNKFLELRGLKDSASAEQKNLLREDITNAAIRPLIGQLFRKLPEKVLAKDSAWSFQQPQTQFLIFQMQNTNKYKVLDLQKLETNKIAIIDAALESKLSGETKFSERGISYEFKKPVSRGEGKIYFNLDKGCIQKSYTKTKIEIFYTMQMPSPRGMQKGTRQEFIVNENIVELL